MTDNTTIKMVMLAVCKDEAEQAVQRVADRLQLEVKSLKTRNIIEVWLAEALNERIDRTNTDPISRIDLDLIG